MTLKCLLRLAAYCCLLLTEKKDARAVKDVDLHFMGLHQHQGVMLCMKQLAQVLPEKLLAS